MWEFLRQRYAMMIFTLRTLGQCNTAIRITALPYNKNRKILILIVMDYYFNSKAKNHSYGYKTL